MASKYIYIKLNQQQHVGSAPSRKSSLVGLPRQESVSSGSTLDQIVEFSFSDTFSTLMERCLLVLNIKGSSDGVSSQSTKSAAKQALMFDKNHVMITMLREI